MAKDFFPLAAEDKPLPKRARLMAAGLSRGCGSPAVACGKMLALHQLDPAHVRFGAGAMSLPNDPIST